MLVHFYHKQKSNYLSGDAKQSFYKKINHSCQFEHINPNYNYWVCQSYKSHIQFDLILKTE